MAIDPNSIGAVTEPMLFEWTDRDTLLYAIGVGAGTGDLAFTTENSHGIDQQVLPTYAVICCPAFGAAAKVGTFNPAALLHGSQGIRLHAPLPAAGKLSVVTEVADIQDKGEGKNAIVVLRGRGCDPESGSLVAETLTTLVLRGQGGFGGARGERPAAPEFPDRHPDARIDMPTREDQALIYRLSGDRNPLHSDPWFATQLAGFPKPILHGLCTYGVAGRALVAELGGGVAANITSIAARFTKPVFPGETLSTVIWRTEPGRAVFRTEVAGAAGAGGGAGSAVPAATAVAAVADELGVAADRAGTTIATVAGGIAGPAVAPGTAGPTTTAVADLPGKPAGRTNAALAAVATHAGGPDTASAVSAGCADTAGPAIAEERPAAAEAPAAAVTAQSARAANRQGDTGVTAGAAGPAVAADAAAAGKPGRAAGPAVAAIAARCTRWGCSGGGGRGAAPARPAVAAGPGVAA